MDVDLTLRALPITEVADAARRTEDLGFDAIGVTESTGNPFVAATLACTSTTRARIATGIALALPRTPMDVAYTRLGSAGAERWTLRARPRVAGPRARRAPLRSVVRATCRPHARAHPRPEGDLRRLGDGRGPPLRGRVLDPHPDAAELPARTAATRSSAGPARRGPGAMLEVVGEVARRAPRARVPDGRCAARRHAPAVERGLERAGRSRSTWRSPPASSSRPARRSGKACGGAWPSTGRPRATGTSSTTTGSAGCSRLSTPVAAKAAGRRCPGWWTTTCSSSLPSWRGSRRRRRRDHREAGRPGRPRVAGRRGSRPRAVVADRCRRSEDAGATLPDHGRVDRRAAGVPEGCLQDHVATGQAGGDPRHTSCE